MRKYKHKIPSMALYINKTNVLQIQGTVILHNHSMQTSAEYANNIWRCLVSVPYRFLGS